MPTRKLEKAQWQAYFDRMSKQLTASTVEIRVAGLELGVQLEADHLRITGVSYDPHADDIVISTEELEHRVTDPREIYVDEELGQLRSVEIIDGAGQRQLVQLTRMLTLPPPPG
jgi:hypothetical protein